MSKLNIIKCDNSECNESQEVGSNIVGQRPYIHLSLPGGNSTYNTHYSYDFCSESCLCAFMNKRKANDKKNKY